MVAPVKAGAEQAAEQRDEAAPSAGGRVAEAVNGATAAAFAGGSAHGRAADPLRRATALQLQRTHGNLAVRGWLARKPNPAPAKPLPADQLIRGLGSAAIVDEDVEGTLYDAPDDTRAPVGTLPKGQSVTLIGTAGDFYIIEFDDKRAYVKQRGIATAIDTPGDQLKADWDAKLRAMEDRLDRSNHKGGAALSAGGGMARASSGPHSAFSAEFMRLQNRLSLSDTWDQDLEDAQALLRDYALWYFTSYHSTAIPPNVRIFLDYVGRSTKNAASADKMKVKSTAHLGGFIKDGQRSIDWCTQSTSQAVMDALAESKSGVTFTALQQKLLPAAKGYINGAAAYTAPLMPGDMVMYLFNGCQFGGHAVTVIDDLGDSFTHVSGNSTNAGVMIGEQRRLTKEPAGPGKFDLAQACPGPVYKDKERTQLDKDATNAAHEAANKYLRTFDAGFGDGALIYSITRYGSLLSGLTAPKPKP
jgi:hypothetical protein